MSRNAWKTYLSDIERFFTVTRTSGFVLSPRDVNQIREWYLKGIPITRILRGIAEGIRHFRFKASPQQRPPHHLAFYTPFVLGNQGNGEGSSGLSIGEGSNRAPTSGPRTMGSRAALPETSFVLLLEHLTAEFELMQLQETRALEQEVKGLYAQRLQEIKRDPGLGSLDEDGLMERLRNLDEVLLALYHSRLDEGDRTRLENTAQTLTDNSSVGRQAARALREKHLRTGLMTLLNIPDWLK